MLTRDWTTRWHFNGCSILVVEDDVDIALMVQLVLEDADAMVSVATSAREATRLLRSSLSRSTSGSNGDVDGRSHYDLLVLDLHLRDGDGADILLGLRSAGYRLPPVIVVSALAHHAADTAADRIDAVHVVYKPFELRTLLACIDDVLRRRS